MQKEINTFFGQSILPQKNRFFVPRESKEGRLQQPRDRLFLRTPELKLQLKVDPRQKKLQFQKLSIPPMQLSKTLTGETERRIMADVYPDGYPKSVTLREQNYQSQMEAKSKALLPIIQALSPKMQPLVAPVRKEESKDDRKEERKEERKVEKPTQLKSPTLSFLSNDEDYEDSSDGNEVKLSSPSALVTVISKAASFISPSPPQDDDYKSEEEEKMTIETEKSIEIVKSRLDLALAGVGDKVKYAIDDDTKAKYRKQFDVWRDYEFFKEFMKLPKKEQLVQIDRFSAFARPGEGKTSQAAKDWRKVNFLQTLIKDRVKVTEKQFEAIVNSDDVKDKIKAYNVEKTLKRVAKGKV